MHIVVGRKPHISYPILLTLGEWFGIISVILAGLLFDKSVSINSGIYDWENSPFSYHPVMMTAGLLFCYGNAILLYRTFKQPPKLLVKIFHAIFLLISLAFGVVGFVAIVRQKDIGNRTHFMTYHSWIGLTTLILFVLQWVFGFIIYLFPTLSLDVRTNYMPTHRLWGKIIFLSASIAVLTGLSEHLMTSSYLPLLPDPQRKRRLIINFFGVFTSLFSLIVIYLLSNPDYQRPPDNVPRSKDPRWELAAQNPDSS